MKKRADILNSHSRKVGEDYYDPTAEQVRGEYIAVCENIEKGEEKESDLESLEDPERLSQKKAMEEEDARISREHASEYLSTLKERSQRNSRCKVKSSHRGILMNIVFVEIFGSTLQRFPKGKRYIFKEYIFINSITR